MTHSRPALDAHNMQVLTGAGFELLYGFNTWGQGSLHEAPTERMTTDLAAKAEQLAANGLRVLIGPGLTPSTKNCRSVGLWVPIDGADIPSSLRLDNGRYSMPELIELPPLAYDGEDTAYRAALLPHAATFLEELAEAEVLYDTRRASRPPLPAGAIGAELEEYITRLETWRREHPDPIASVESSWRERLDTAFTNNLHLLFVTDNAGEPAFNTALSREWIAKLEAYRPDFVRACRQVAQVRIEADSMAVHSVEGLSADQEISRVIDGWVCDAYMTYAADTLRLLGVSQYVLRRLMN